MKTIIDLLQVHTWYEGSEVVRIAKGKYELPKDYKGWITKIKRKIKEK